MSTLIAATTTEWIRFGAVLVGGLVLAQGVQLAVVRAEGRSGGHQGAIVLGRLVRLALATLALVYALSQIGVRIGPLLAAAGVGGVALAFAVQSIFQNFLAGILLLLRRPFTPGDEIVSGDISGVVEDVNLRAVVVRTYDGRRAYVPNASVLNAPILNESARAVRRDEVEIGLDYTTDLAPACELLRAATAAVDGVVADPPTEVYASAFDASAITVHVRFWYRATTPELWRVRHAVVVALQRAADEHAITIPFDQLDVRWHGAGPPDGGEGG